MKAAIEEAKKCEIDVPIGCVIKKDGKIIASASNRRELDNDITAHAEILAIKEAQKLLNSSRLKDCEMYVTLEPCPMCAGACINARVRSVVFGAYDEKAGCCGTLYNLPIDTRFNHRPTVIGGVMEKECAQILTDFFKGLRNKTN